MDETLNVSLLTPASDLISGVDGVELDVIFGRAGNDIFYGYDPILDANLDFNVDILVGDLFDNTAEEFAVTLEIANGNPLAILDADIPSVGKDRFVLGDEFQAYYTSPDPLSLLNTNSFGFNEFAVLYDFDPIDDVIQLNGKKDDYNLVSLDSVPFNGNEFSGFGIFSLQTGAPDLIGLIVGDPNADLELKDKDIFQFTGSKPKDKPKEKKVGQFGTSGLDFGYGVATDPNGNLYVTGSTSGALNGLSQGSSDVWVTRYDFNGNQSLVRQYGSSDGDVAYSIVTDQDGNFYLAGSTSGDLAGALQSSEGTDAWVAKYNSDGNQLWARQFGENSVGGDFGFSTSGFGLQVDGSGNVYLSGLTINENNKINPATGQPFLDFAVEDDSWVIKFDSKGEQQWFTKIVDPQQPTGSPLAITPFFDESYDMAVDEQGNSYLVGWTQGIAKESDPSRLLLKYDAWISKVDTDGNVLWTQQFGSLDEGLEFAWAVDTDSQGNIYVSGWTSGDIGTRDKEFEKSDGYDVWLTKFTPDGTQLWTKQVGSKGDDGAYFSDLVIDDNDNIFLSGYTNEKLGKGSKDKEGTNGWVGKFDTNGNNEWIQQVGIKGKADYATGLAVNNSGQVFVTGFTEGFLGNGNNFQAQGAAVDAWIAQLDADNGKLIEFTGNIGEVIAIDDPSPISTVDISTALVTDEQLPDGDNVIQTIESVGTGVNVVDYGEIGANLASAFDPGDPNSVTSALDELLVNDPSLIRFNQGDVLMGQLGDDKMKGTDGNDALYGYEGNDKLEGKDGNDTLYGGIGNDELKGGYGDDVLIGIDPNIAFGKGEIDEMKGEKGADLFVLGDANRVYYDDGFIGSSGLDDYAFIEKFELKEQDKIQLNGTPEDYILGSSPIKEKGLAIYLTSGQESGAEELIAVLKDYKVDELSLNNGDVFSYV